MITTKENPDEVAKCPTDQVKQNTFDFDFALLEECDCCGAIIAMRKAFFTGTQVLCDKCKD